GSGGGAAKLVNAATERAAAKKYFVCIDRKWITDTKRWSAGMPILFDVNVWNAWNVWNFSSRSTKTASPVKSASHQAELREQRGAHIRRSPIARPLARDRCCCRRCT